MIQTPQYISANDADAYMATRLNTEVWDAASDDKRNAALIQATRAIDRLNFLGIKTVESQAMQFPRDGSVVTPDDILIACCECALSYLDGIDMELEINDLNLQSSVYSGVRDTYDRTINTEHLRAGIPSAVAWTHLQGYLVDPNQINLSRVN
jgi:hypothetical protein